jgi:glycosyltransferase involved in cell wall biosynthesis
MSPRIALLTNDIPPYRVPLFQAVRQCCADFRIFISTEMEPDRPWQPDWSDLDVIVQKTLTLTRVWRRPPIDGKPAFDERLFIHVPYDTLPRLLRYAPDVVVSGEFGLRSLQAALYRRLRPRSRLLIWATLSEHTEKGWGRMRRVLRRFILRAADGVLVNGASGERYVSSLGVFTRVFVVNQPVDVAPFAALPLERPPDAARRIIFSGRFIERKGVREFQRAAASWARLHRERRLEIVWLGDGEMRERLETAEAPVNLVQTFVGSVPYADLPAAYASCGVLVLPSFCDEWGLVVNEAMASGMPVLGSVYSQAVEEMVVDGRTGWLFDPAREETMTGALDRLFEASEAELGTMRGWARERAMAITPEGAADRMLAAILAAAATGTPRPAWAAPGAGTQAARYTQDGGR